VLSRESAGLLPPGARLASAGERATTGVAGPLDPQATEATEGRVAFVPITTAFNGIVDLDYHYPTRTTVISANSPSGQPTNFELISSDGARNAYSSLRGLPDEARFATARENAISFTSGELVCPAVAPGALAKVSYDGASVANPWVVLPGETGRFTAFWIDRTGIFGGDLLVGSSSGNVWRVSAAGQPRLLANLGAGVTGLVTLPKDPHHYGPWSGKILASASAKGTLATVTTRGKVKHYNLGLHAVDLDLVGANENFFALDDATKTVWGAPHTEFAEMVGDLVVATGTPGTLTRVRWGGASFLTEEIATLPSLRAIAFVPAGVVEVEEPESVTSRVALVRHAPQITGRLEGSIQQTLGESVALSSANITADLLVPGKPALVVSGRPTFNGVVA